MRIGYQMDALARAVARDPGHCILYYVDGHYTTRRGYSSRQFGYEAMHRAIRAKLVTATWNRNRYTLFPGPAWKGEDHGNR